MMKKKRLIKSSQSFCLVLLLEGPISINIALHLAMAYTDVIKYIDLDSPLLYKEMSDELEFEYRANEINFLSTSF